jgi:hypothetical protein
MPIVLRKPTKMGPPNSQWAAAIRANLKSMCPEPVSGDEKEFIAGQQRVSQLFPWSQGIL